MKIITISGASGSGKSTLAELIYGSLPNSLLLSLDRYYLSKEEQINKNGYCNFDYPEAIDGELLKQDLISLKSKKPTRVPRYDFTISQRSGYEEVSASDCIIIEGLFAGSLIKDMSDLDIFIEVDLDLALLRRIQRDINQRGRSLASVTEQYLRDVRPAYFKHVESIKLNSDMILENNGSEDHLIKATQKIIKKLKLNQ